MRRSKVLLTIALICGIFCLASSSYAVSTKLYVQGRLTTATGAYLPAGTYSVRFNIYGSETAPTPLWFDTFAGVTVGASGVFNVTLGSQKALGRSILYPEKPILPKRVSVFGSNSRWLEVVVSGEPFGPRVKINPSSYAGNADTLDGNDWKFFSPATHTHSFDKIIGTISNTQIPATITRDSELTAGLAGKANTVHHHAGEDITSGTVSESRIDPAIARKAAVDAHIAALQSSIVSLQAAVASLQNKVDSQQAAINDLASRLEGVTRSPDKKTLTFTGMNLQVVSGSGTTVAPPNGLGNLIVGYNESRGTGDVRTGSHNIIVGRQNNYSSTAGLVVGAKNEISNIYSSISGGYGNIASGSGSSVSGGYGNTASGYASSVSGGGGNDTNLGNIAFADYSSILGGQGNLAGDPNKFDHSIGQRATISAGANNQASGGNSTVSGGAGNIASGGNATVSGGEERVAEGNYNWAGGGLFQSY